MALWCIEKSSCYNLFLKPKRVSHIFQWVITINLLKYIFKFSCRKLTLFSPICVSEIEVMCVTMRRLTIAFKYFIWSSRGLLRYSGFPLRPENLENLEKWEGIFQSQGILIRLEKSGKSHGKSHKILENSGNFRQILFVIFSDIYMNFLLFAKMSQVFS